MVIGTPKSRYYAPLNYATTASVYAGTLIKVLIAMRRQSLTLLSLQTCRRHNKVHLHCVSVPGRCLYQRTGDTRCTDNRCPWVRPLSAGRRPAHCCRRGPSARGERTANARRAPSCATRGGKPLPLRRGRQPDGGGALQDRPVAGGPGAGPPAGIPRRPHPVRYLSGRAIRSRVPGGGHPRGGLQALDGRRQGDVRSAQAGEPAGRAPAGH
jgi:hypothetical protein